MAKQHDISAQNFREPLLQALATLSGFTAHQSVKHKETFGPVCSTMGITLDQYGNQQNTGLPWVQKWIGWAYKELKKEGLAATTDGAGMRIPRGWWALTTQGVDEARKLAGDQPTDPAPPAEEDVPILANGEDDRAPDQVVSYHEDPYIRGLAIGQSPCFGTVSSRSTVCARCPLRRECEVQLQTLMSAFAVQVDGALVAFRAMENQPAPEAKKVESKEDPKAKVAEDIADFLGAERVKAAKSGRLRVKSVDVAHEAVCAACSQTIPKGGKGKWVRSDDKTTGGIYHPHCLVIQEGP